jgi:hypothetical protein
VSMCECVCVSVSGRINIYNNATHTQPTYSTHSHTQHSYLLPRPLGPFKNTEGVLYGDAVALPRLLLALLSISNPIPTGKGGMGGEEGVERRLFVDTPLQGRL